MTDFRSRTLRLLVAAALTVGIAGTSTAAYALTPPAPQQQLEIANPTDPGDPTPPQGPGDLTNGEDPDGCHPLAASCDITSNPGDPGDPDDGDGDGGDPEVDDAVVAHPTFTG